MVLTGNGDPRPSLDNGQVAYYRMVSLSDDHQARAKADLDQRNAAHFVYHKGTTGGVQIVCAGIWWKVR